jgi:hypothetical protein
MRIDDIIEFLDTLGGVLTLRPGPEDGSPEISWGDLFFYYAPDGVVPQAQPFATIVTKDYPDDESSRLFRPGAFRLNIAAGAAEFTRWTGRDPRAPTTRETDGSSEAGSEAKDDVLLPHPVYASLGWLAVVNPGPETNAPARELLRASHQQARARHQRRRG